MSKYAKLWEFFAAREEKTIILSFADINAILGFSLDHSFLNYKKELADFGYAVTKISLKEKTILFTKL